MSAQRPVWLLDVDGVINSWDMPGRKHPGYRRITVDADGASYPIVYSPALVDRLVQLHEAESVELVWLTTWLDHANRALAPALGLPHLRVLPRDESLAEHPSRSATWWKQAAVAAELASAPGRPFVWTDDDLTRYVKDAVRARFPNHPGLMLTTMRTPGLTLANLDRIDQFLHTRDR